MNCFEFRHQLIVDPETVDNEALYHMKNCAGCAEFFSRIKKFNVDISAAIKIEVPENFQSEILLQQSLKPEKKQNITFYLALAASLIILITAAFMTVWDRDNYNLDELVITYVEGVHSAGYSSSKVDHQVVDRVLNPLGMQLDSGFGPIQAARPCYIRGKAAAHLVMPGNKGPIDILYMPSEDIEQRIQVTERGNQLILIPCPRGSVAIIGSTGEQLANIESRLRNASSWL